MRMSGEYEQVVSMDGMSNTKPVNMNQVILDDSLSSNKMGLI